MIIIVLIFGIIVFALILQVYILKAEIKKRKLAVHVEEGYLKEYAGIVDTNRIIESGNRVMEALEAGKIKKHLLHNDAPIYNSEDAVKKYLDFISGSELSDYIINIEDDNYYGQS